MELNREQIIKAMECCRTNSEMDCIDCPYRNKGNDLYAGCVNTLLVDALSLIKELTEENERLRAENDDLCDNIACLEFDNENAERRTVRKMQEQLKMEIDGFGRKDGFVTKETVCWFIDQIAEEVIGEVK
jgi:hypothetical protein